MELNKDFIKNMETLFKNDFSDFLHSYSNLENDSENGIRLNTLKIKDIYELNEKNNEEETQIEKFTNLNEFEKTSWCEQGFYFKNSFRPAKTLDFHLGKFYIQEPSAMIVVSVSNIKKGDKVLDVCAAPGGKTTQIASKLENTGIIISNDISASRCKALVKNVELMGITNTIVISENPTKFTSRFLNYFDKIIVDAPCSGEGMFRKKPDVMKEWNSEKPKFYSDIQKEILENCVLMLSNGGEITYSTCTFNMVENEEVINYILSKNENLELVEIEHNKFGIEQGFKLENSNFDLTKTGRILPHKQKGEGHFVAILRKKQTSTQDKIIALNTKEQEEFDAIPEDFIKFCTEFFVSNKFENIKVNNEKIYNLPKNCPNLKGIRVHRSGLLLGEIKNNRFEPSQSLAMTLSENDVKNFAVLSNENALRYIKGESFEVKAKNGWCLMMHGEKNLLPIGFGKVVNGRMKNKYAKSWIY